MKAATVELLVAADERRSLCAQRLEAADDAALASHLPGARRLGKARERLRPEIFDLEQTADLMPRAIGDDDPVGRGQSLQPRREVLARRWHQAKTGEGRVVLISGEPGIGKSRLTAALAERIAGEPHTRLRYFSSPHHQDSALYPFIVQLERAAGFARYDTPEQKLGKLDALTVGGAAEPDEITLIAELLSLPNAAAELDISPQRKREKLLAGLLHQLEALAKSHPVLMVFDDAHWIDPTSRDLIDLTVDRVRRLPVLLLVTFRPEFQPPWTDQSHVTTVVLNRLGERDGSALVERLAGNAGVSSEFVAEIVERSDGVPLFIEELTRAVVEAGADRGASTVSGMPASALAVPATLHASLLGRLDRLGPTAKMVAQAGAAIGRNFSYDLLAAAAELAEPVLQEALRRLVGSGLVFQRGRPAGFGVSVQARAGSGHRLRRPRPLSATRRRHRVNRNAAPLLGPVGRLVGGHQQRKRLRGAGTRAAISRAGGDAVRFGTAPQRPPDSWVHAVVQR
jgi:hypothetical protein